MTNASTLPGLAELRRRYGVISDLRQIGDLLDWDRNTYMPSGAAEVRGQQLATLMGLVHERLVDPGLRDVLRDLARAGLPEDSPEAAMLRQAERDVRRASRLPSDFVEERSRHSAVAQQAWTEARAASDFCRFQPHLETLLELKRREADYFGFDAHPYDALHDLYEPGSTAERLRSLFGPLREATVALLGDLRASGAEVDDGVLHGSYPEDKQEQFGLEVARGFGYDLRHGRLDRSVHPFAQALGKFDVRITTRYKPGFLSTALFGTMHETGHALYEQGVHDDYQRTPLASPISLGVHESQSRLWENLVGRSYAFWEGCYPRLQELFPERLGGVPLADFYAAVNRVEPSLVRVEADEVTYNLHVLVRFELELELLEGSLRAAELPEAWNAKYEDYLGVRPGDDAEGCLQDIHWAAGLFGYFPTYALGNLMSVQLYEAAERDLPGLGDDVRHCDYGRLLGWLRENVHQHGSRYDPDELLERATGRGLDAEPYVRYLNRKFRALYGLE